MLAAIIYIIGVFISYRATKLHNSKYGRKRSRSYMWIVFSFIHWIGIKIEGNNYDYFE